MNVFGELLGEEVANDFFHIDDERFEDDVMWKDVVFKRLLSILVENISL